MGRLGISSNPSGSSLFEVYDDVGHGWDVSPYWTDRDPLRVYIIGQGPKLTWNLPISAFLAETTSVTNPFYRQEYG